MKCELSPFTESRYGVFRGIIMRHCQREWRGCSNRTLTLASLIAVSLLALSGCVRYQSKQLDPAKNLARIEQRSLADTALKQYIARNFQKEQTPWPPASWDLKMLTMAAFHFNPDIEVARAKYAVVAAGKKTAAARPNPTLNLTPSRNTTTTIPSPWLVTATLDIPIETAGKRGYRMAGAGQLSRAAQLGIASTAWDVRTRVRKSFLTLWSASEAETLLQRQMVAQSNIVQLLDQQLELGAIARTELTRERIALQQSRLALFEAQNRRSQARVELAAAIGLPVHAIDDVVFNFDAFTEAPHPPVSAEARRRALLGRADVLAALSEYAASESALHLEIARQYPDIHLSPGYEYDQGNDKWGLGVGVELPVINQNRGPIAEAKARRSEAAARFNVLQAGVLNAIETAEAGCASAQAQLDAASAILKEAEQREKLAHGMFDVGEVPRQALAAAAIEQTAAALAALDARSKAQDALGQLEGALQSPLEIPASILEIPILLEK